MLRKISTLLLLGAWFNTLLFAGSGLGLDKPIPTGKVFYIGIGADTLFLTEGYPVRSPFSYKDVERVSKHLENRAGGADSFNSFVLHTSRKKELLSIFEQINQKARPEDAIVFYFGGYNHKIQIGKSIQEGFFLSPPELTDQDEPLARIDSNLYFTLAELRIWLNAVPAKKQLVLIEAGFTDQLKREVTSMLLESNHELALLDNRKRILLFPQGVGVEDAMLKAGRFTWAMTTGLERSNRNLLDAFDPRRAPSFEFEVWKSYIEVNRNETSSTKGLNLIKEWEIQEIMISGSNHKKRGENLAIKPKPISVALDSLPKFYAFICATDTYDHLEDLNNPVRDADSLSAVLSQKYGFITHVLRNPANSEAFFRELRNFKDTARFTHRDELLIFVAGHGIYDGGFHNTGFIAFKDCDTNDVSKKSYIEYKMFVGTLDAIPCKKIMLVLDVCYGGSLSQGLVSQADPRKCNASMQYEKHLWPYNVTQGASVFRNLNCANRVYMTSGGYEYVEDGLVGGHSPFAGSLLEVLQANTMPVLYSNDVYNGIKRQLDEVAGMQSPTYGRFGLDNNSTDFIFVRKK